MYRKYWLLPFFLGIIGGVIGWLVVKEKDSKSANHILIFGIVWPFVPILLVGIYTSLMLNA